MMKLWIPSLRILYFLICIVIPNSVDASRRSKRTQIFEKIAWCYFVQTCYSFVSKIFYGFMSPDKHFSLDRDSPKKYMNFFRKASFYPITSRLFRLKSEVSAVTTWRTGTVVLGRCGTQGQKSSSTSSTNGLTPSLSAGDGYKVSTQNDIIGGELNWIHLKYGNRVGETSTNFKSF